MNRTIKNLAKSVCRSRRGRQRPAKQENNIHRQNDHGFTLVELLIVVTIIPIIIGSIALALLATFRLQSGVSDRLSSSADAQVVAANFYRDVQSSTFFTTQPSPTATATSPSVCTPSSQITTQILGLEWGTGATKTIVSYVQSDSGMKSATGAAEYLLERVQCTWTYGTTTAPVVTGENVLSYNVPLVSAVSSANGLYVQVTGSSCTTTCDSNSPWQNGWVSATGIKSISFYINEASSKGTSFDTTCPTGTTGAAICFVVASAPRTWETTNGGVPPTPVAGLAPVQFLTSAGPAMQLCSSGNPGFLTNGALLLGATNATMINQNGGAGQGVYANPATTLTGTPSISSYLIPGSTSTSVSSMPSNPLSSITAPSTSGLSTYDSLSSATQNSVDVGGTTYVYVKPGIYNFNLNSSDHIILNSGTYIVQKTWNASITSGVGGDLVYLSSGGSISGSNLNIWPTTSGTYAGISLYSNNSPVSLGPNTYQLGGVVYLPNGALNWNGNANIWIGSLLAQRTSCSGGGGGQTNVNWSQYLTFTSTPPTAPSINSTYNVNAIDTSSPNSGQPVTYSIDPLSSESACSISGSVVTFLSSGTCLIDANQSGTDQSINGSTVSGGYLPAPTIQQSISVTSGGEGH